MRLFEIAAVNKFHVSVDIESHFFFIFIVELAWFEVDVEYSDVQLETEAKFGTSYIN